MTLPYCIGRREHTFQLGKNYDHDGKKLYRSQETLSLKSNVIQGLNHMNPSTSLFGLTEAFLNWYGVVKVEVIILFLS